MDISNRPIPADYEVVAQLSEQLKLGMHHMTSDGRDKLAELIAAYRKRYFTSVEAAREIVGYS